MLQSSDVSLRPGTGRLAGRRCLVPAVPRSRGAGLQLPLRGQTAGCPSIGLQAPLGPAGRAVARFQRDTSAQAITATPSFTTHKDLALRNGARVKVTVDQNENGDQILTIDSDVQAGRLLLHWGVEGGKDYKGGWRLPGQSTRPEGTVQYKDRALQTPFKMDTNGRQRVVLHLDGEEASDFLNFVLKDDATNTWYDNNGTNFKVELRPDATSPALKLDQLPKDLCDKWAWTRWDHAGRPERDQGAASAEYDRGVSEMRELLTKGRTLDELWRVAEGKWKYSDYRKKVIQPTIGDSMAPAMAQPRSVAPPPQQQQQQQQAPRQAPAEVSIPEDLVGVQAYVLWEHAGKPDGADFSEQARRVIAEQMAAGASAQDVAAKLNYTLKPGAGSVTASLASPVGTPAASRAGTPMQSMDAPPKAAAEPVVVGKPLGTPKRNPLDMIKRSADAPVLSAERSTAERPLDFLVQRFAVDPATRWRRTYPLGGKAELLVVVRQRDDSSPVRVDLVTDTASDMVLHWGVCPPGSRDWVMPDDSIQPEGSVVIHKAVETPFLNCDDDECDVEVSGAKVPLQRITVTLPSVHHLGALTFVLRSSDSTMWYKEGGGNFVVPVPSKDKPVENQAETEVVRDELSRNIIEAEVQSSQWTLMHRFNKAADLISEVLNGYYDMDVADAMSRIFVWLRYSSTRQLTWQRNYNTQPRILSAAQERLTNTISNAHSRTTGEAQEWVRSMLTTVGRGGDGQRIRDEILHIMHRNHIPEKKGLWMEEWHQKLHNNTTPDDVPICEAYLAFLESNGNLGAYWRVLSDAGITRQRLESFDRAITLEPEFYRDKKDALVRDFRNYLGILKAVHSGADLQASASAAGNRIPGGARGYLAYVMSNMGGSQVLPLLEACVEARTELAPSLPGCRELLYLDLALEEQARSAVERGVGAAGFGAGAFMRPLLQNLCLSLGNNEELCYCLKAWNELPASVKSGGRPNKEEALLAVAVVNRIRRALADISDHAVHRIGGVSKAYGRAFGVEPWAYELFAEELIRGGPAFAVSLVITAIEPMLRNAAALGAWQVISPIEATGIVEVVSGLHEVQEKTYTTPTVLIAQQVTGEEEIPEGVVAVITPDAPDVLSHVSVRARNMRVFFGTCHDDKPMQQLRDMAGKWIHLTPSASGAVTWTETQPPTAGASDAAAAAAEHSRPTKGLKIEVPTWCGRWVVGMDDYKDGVVGAKSKNLANLRGRLPANINLPSSVTLPFGCFEQALELPENADVKKGLATLVARVHGKTPSSGAAGGLLGMVGLGGGKAEANGNGNGNGASSGMGGASPAELLAECRKLAMRIKVPRNVRDELQKSMQDAGISPPEDEERWGLALEALKGVWASKYNDRAYYSLKKAGLDFDSVRMAVLVQRVVPAQYAFVIHTRNPSNNDEKEVFCELVKGLGESLVSGMVPGSAVAFKANKEPSSALENPEVLCYASKSEAMYVRDSLIFRSDSNGEDLEGYAGAGLYDSITMDPSLLKKVDYMEDRLVQDPAYRRELLGRVCRLGADIEVALGTAQDIEGVVAPDGAITVVQTRPQV